MLRKFSVYPSHITELELGRLSVLIRHLVPEAPPVAGQLLGLLLELGLLK